MVTTFDKMGTPGSYTRISSSSRLITSWSVVLRDEGSGLPLLVVPARRYPLRWYTGGVDVGAQAGSSADLGTASNVVVAPKRPRRRKRARRWWRWGTRAVGPGALVAAAPIAVIVVLGHLADWFAGSGWLHLLPFAAAVLGLAIVTAFLLSGWFVARAWLRRSRSLLAPVALIVAASTGWFATRPLFHHEVGSLHALVGGSAQGKRIAIAHQPYAAYRRSEVTELQRIQGLEIPGPRAAT
jgi:hypothetical protein